MIKLAGQYRSCPVPGAAECQAGSCGQYIPLDGLRGICGLAAIGYSFLKSSGPAAGPVHKGKKLCGFAPGTYCAGEMCMLWLPSEGETGHCLANALSRSSPLIMEIAAMVDAMEQRETLRRQAQHEETQRIEAEKEREDKVAKEAEAKLRAENLRSHQTRRSTVNQTAKLKKRREQKRNKAARKG